MLLSIRTILTPFSSTPLYFQLFNLPQLWNFGFLPNYTVLFHFSLSNVNPYFHFPFTHTLFIYSYFLDNSILSLHLHFLLQFILTHCTLTSPFNPHPSLQLYYFTQLLFYYSIPTHLPYSYYLTQPLLS